MYVYNDTLEDSNSPLRIGDARKSRNLSQVIDH